MPEKEQLGAIYKALCGNGLTGEVAQFLTELWGRMIKLEEAELARAKPKGGAVMGEMTCNNPECPIGCDETCMPLLSDPINCGTFKDQEQLGPTLRVGLEFYRSMRRELSELKIRVLREEAEHKQALADQAREHGEWEARLVSWLAALRDGIDTPEYHCDPLPMSSSWRAIAEVALAGSDAALLEVVRVAKAEEYERIIGLVQRAVTEWSLAADPSKWVGSDHLIQFLAKLRDEATGR